MNSSNLFSHLAREMRHYNSFFYRNLKLGGYKEILGKCKLASSANVHPTNIKNRKITLSWEVGGVVYQLGVFTPPT